MSRPKLDLGSLRKALGEKAFARGQGYFENGLIDLIGIDADRVFATAFGSETYGVELVSGPNGRGVSGRCSCPAFEDWGVCKHMAAAALAVEALTPEGVESARERLVGLRDGLRVQGIEALIDMIVGFATRDPDLLEMLEGGPRDVEDDGCEDEYAD